MHRAMECAPEGVRFRKDEHSSASSLSVDAGKSRESSPRASMDDALKSEEAFIEFVMSLPEEVHRSTDSSCCKVGLDHLDNLCKLMEQLGELRDNNNKLQKRVQYLEDLKTLHDMHKEIREDVDSEEVSFPLQKSLTETRCTSRTPSKHRRSMSGRGRARGRSKSVGHEEGDDPKSKSIFPKWSRVKEALGWESERKESVKGKCDPQVLRRSSDDTKSCPRGGWDDPSVFNSSAEEVHALIQRCTTDGWRRRTCDKRLSLLEPPSESLRRQKSTPSPGSDRVTSYTPPMDLKPKSSTIERDAFVRFEKEEGKRGKSPWGRVKTIIERRRDSLKRRHLRRDPELGDSKKSLDPLQPLELGSPHSADEVDKGPSKDPESTPSSSPPFHRKSRWTRVKKVLRGRREGEPSSQSTPASPDSTRDGNFNFDALEEMSEDSSEGLMPVRVGSEGQVHRLAVPQRALMLELERNLSDDFHRKMREWERMRAKKKPEKGLKPKLKDLAWLDKELNKIEKEKQRLSKERSKYEERALRLEKLRETVLSARSSTKKEVLVRTSAGEFRFEGISDAFTKKLYEWETKRGFGPELSTIALLDGSRPSVQPKLSRSESSLAEVGQHSHNSSNSLPSLMPHEDAERLDQHSRANSEPDLSTRAAFVNGTSFKESLESLVCAEEVCCKRDQEEEEEEEDEDGRKRKDSEKYYGLLEENVILLEQLKDKEELCRRLEKELESLDEKVEDMNARHTQQMERYREKLWEMHKPGTSPTAVQGCLTTMAQLRKRIEALERCTEKLRNDRESVEDSFRYHSKQQEHMTLDLLEKMRELQAAGGSSETSDAQAVQVQKGSSSLDASAVERLQELSALLVKQTEELEATLSAKTRQICELRWELLHRDLSSVRLETELHTRTAHAKRAKYAHFRSLSSEEASATHRPPPPTDRRQQPRETSLASEEAFGGFQATELSNTVHQLNRELLRLSSANEYYASEEKVETSSNCESANPEKLSERRSDDQMTVRRSSADSVNARLITDRARLSSDEESSSEESFTRVSWCSDRRGEDSTMVLVRNKEERLLRSQGEHPNNRVHRRKKISRNSSVRKRSNGITLPRKCQSFRETRDRVMDDGRNNSSDSKLNVRRSSANVRTDSAPKSDFDPAKDDHQIIFPSPNGWTSERPKRDHLQRKRSKRRVKSPEFPLASKTEYAPNDPQEIIDINSPQAPEDKNCCVNEDSLTVTIILPKRKFSADITSKENETVEETVMVAMPKKRSLSSENETEVKKYGEQHKDNQLPRLELLTPSSGHRDGNSESDESFIRLGRPELLTPSSEHRDGDSESDESFIRLRRPELLTPSSGHRDGDSESDGSFIQLRRPELLNLSSGHRDGDSESDESFIQLRRPELPTPSSGHRDGNSESNESFIQLRTSGLPVNVEDTIYPKTSRKRKVNDVESNTETEEDNIGLEHDEECMTVQTPNVDQLCTVPNHQSEFPASGSQEAPSRCCFKSPSAPQLDWRKVCAKKVVKGGAPNVKVLIERYNQRAMGSPSGSNLSSPIRPRKGNIPRSSSSTPTIVCASSFYCPLIFKPTNLDLFPKCPPTSPASRARAQALQKAKESFIAASPQMLPSPPVKDHRAVDGPEELRICPPETEETKLNKSKPILEGRRSEEEDRISMDSMSLVMFRTGESCQESRRLSKRDQQQRDHKEETFALTASKSLSSSSLFRTVLGNDFKMPSTIPGLLRLKRSRRKKDMVTVSQLCRQSLLLSEPGAAARSCPSSPELKAKTGWFHRHIFRHK